MPTAHAIAAAPSRGGATHPLAWRTPRFTRSLATAGKLDALHRSEFLLFHVRPTRRIIPRLSGCAAAPVR
jgi:hypothetical protein